jgi:hypothetical protein
MYDDTFGLLDKEGDTRKWGAVYQMFKKYKFSTYCEDQDELKIFKNIRRYEIFRVAACAAVFPCTDSITWRLKHIYLRNIYVCNFRRDPITSFQPKDLEKCYHLKKGNNKLDKKILAEFEHIA